MKDIIRKMLKAQNVIKFIFLILFSNTILSQDIEYNKISKSEYDVINSLFKAQNNKKKIYIYYRTYSDKCWSHYFTDESLKLITDKVGIPTKITDIELRTYLTNKVLEDIYQDIYLSRSLRLDSKKIINKNIKLVKSFDKSKSIKKQVIRITKPIIIGNIAILKKIEINESPIFIFKKVNEEWKLVYTFYDWSINY